MEKIYYISQGETPIQHLENIENACKAGVRLIQLRLKDTTDEDYFETAIHAKAISNDFNATLIINDNITVAKQINAGVHLGRDDESVSKAKKELEDKLVGGTANTLEDCLELIAQNVDYIGLGPFAFTQTKNDLNPILGLEGYISIISELKKMGYSTPIYAVGGITEKDYKSLIDVGVHGVAVSGLLSNKDNQSVCDIVKKMI